MQEELNSTKSEATRKKIREKYRPITIRDLKAGRGKWDDDEFNVDNDKEIKEQGIKLVAKSRR